jgi:hypothetical protein
MPAIRYRTVEVDALKVFYREVGTPGDLSCCCFTAFPAPVICSGT